MADFPIVSHFPGGIAARIFSGWPGLRPIIIFPSFILMLVLETLYIFYGSVQISTTIIPGLSIPMTSELCLNTVPLEQKFISIQNGGTSLQLVSESGTAGSWTRIMKVGGQTSGNLSCRSIY